MNQKTNCIVAQSGGPTVAINASLSGVIKGAMQLNCFENVYGALNGITGILNHRIMNLSEKAKEDASFLSKLKITPAMYLGSCRYKLPEVTKEPEVYQQIFDFFQEMKIRAFFYIGGNDSMDTVLKLSSYGKSIDSPVVIIGIPKTIDNDLYGTDHTPGFGSAAKYVASSLLEIAHDTYIYQLKSVTIVEIMGRDAGWLTAASVLARNEYNQAPDLIYLPERDFNQEECIADVEELLKHKDNIIIAISEGIHDDKGNYISASQASNDQFGHSQLSGAGKALEYIIKDALNVKVRSVEINVLQRCGAHLSSLTDLDESVACGEKAVELSLENISGVMVCIVRETQSPYRCSIGYADISGIANEVKHVPQNFINARGNQVTSEMVDYLLPLIQGEPEIPFKNGIPDYLNISHLL